MAIDQVLLCKECVHSRVSVSSILTSYIFEFRSPRAHWYRCSKTFKPEHENIDPVIGREKISAEMKRCMTERSSGSCGPSAKYWSPKHKKDLFKVLTKEIKND